MSADVDYVATLGSKSLPSGWRAVTLEDLVATEGAFVDGDWVESKDQDPAGDVRLIQLADVGDGEYRNRSERFLTSQKAAELGCTFLEPGDLLIARMPDPLGRACIFPGDQKRSVTVVDVAIVRPRNPDVNTRWLSFCINAPQFRSVVASLQSGSTRQRISRRNLAKIVFPLPPVDWQGEVVGEIEKQLSRLDEAVANLKRAKANLKRYKAAVLKAAVEGRLVPTEAELARLEGRSYESGSQLLSRVLHERYRAWSGKGSYREPAAPVEGYWASLPAGWTVASLEAITSAARVICYGILMPKENVDDGVLYVKVRDIKDDAIDLASLHRTSRAIAASYARASLRAGDLLVSIRGTYGRVATVPPALEGGNITQDTARLAVSKQLDAAFVGAFLRSEDAQRYFKTVARGVAVKGVNIGDLRPMAVPVPPIAEQHRIVAEVERRLSIVREVEAEVDSNLRRAETLRRQILSEAFVAPRGEVDRLTNEGTRQNVSA